LKKGHYLDDTSVGERMILKGTLRKKSGTLWTGFQVAQCRDRWRDLTKTAMKLRIPLKVGNF
jgi:hypothetical protein